MLITDFLDDVLSAALISRYRSAVATPGADVGAARAAVENEFMDRQREERAELRDYLDVIRETPGAPRGRKTSNFDTRLGARRPTE